MIEKLRQRILDFINSDKDTPVLAGLAVGFYLILFYYSGNFALANSLIQFLFFTAYYVFVPVLVLYAGYKILPLFKMESYRKNYLFVVMPVLFFYYIFELIALPFTEKGTLVVIMLVSWFVSKKYRKYYKLFIVLLFFLSVFNLPPILEAAFTKRSTQWQKQPDNIEQVTFKKKPNIYYIQPDGYTNPVNLKDSIHNFDNNNFWGYLNNNGFTVYPDQRSNYYSTLLSNSATFSMKHHYCASDIEEYSAREIIVGENAVLRTLKHNDYKTHFITEKPYLLINRPDLGYDFCNVAYSDIPFLKDGWSQNYDVIEDLKKQMQNTSQEGNFFFLEKFTPGHISVYKKLLDNEFEKEIDAERATYLNGIKDANVWLEELIGYITKNDPNGIIIIGADHGGFAGFAYSLQSQYKTNNKLKKNSMFGTLLAIKWNDDNAKLFDKDLKTNVNLFRVVFSYLSQDKALLNNLQEDASYVHLKEPQGIYIYIDAEGKHVFEKLENVQD